VSAIVVNPQLDTSADDAWETAAVVNIVGCSFWSYPKSAVAVVATNSGSNGIGIVNINSCHFNWCGDHILSSTDRTNFLNSVPEWTRGFIVMRNSTDSAPSNVQNLNLSVTNCYFERITRGIVVRNVRATRPVTIRNNYFRPAETGAPFLTVLGLSANPISDVVVSGNESEQPLLVSVSNATNLYIIKNLSVGHASPFTITNVTNVVNQQNIVV